MSGKPDQASLLRASEYFDAGWYLREYPDVGSIGMDPVEHYLRFGARLGRDPGPRFSTRAYLASHSEAGGANPLLHFLSLPVEEQQRFAAQSRPEPSVAPIATLAPRADIAAVPAASKPDVARPKPAATFRLRDLNGQDVELSPVPCFGSAAYQQEAALTGPGVILPFGDEAKPAGNWPSLGVHLHLYYADLLDEFAWFLSKIPVRFALYVSVIDPALAERTLAHFARALPDAQVTVRAFANRGRDIAAFVAGFGADLKGHELICHIHSKRSPHNAAKADWRRQLLVNLMGSRSTALGALRLLRDNPHLGLVFPEYHASLSNQISWGTNFGACTALSRRLGVEIQRETLKLFPAGSMFWARSAALAKLLDANLAYSDFSEEQAQIDGTLAHAVERMLGEIVSQSGYELLQVKAAKQHKLIFYHSQRWPYLAGPARTVKSNSARKVAVYTAIAGGYDEPLAPEVRDATLDYALFSDRAISDCGIWDVRPMDQWDPESVRMARYVKTHPHKYFEGYDLAIWVDANVVIRGDLQKYIALVDDDVPLLAVPHPLRDCAYAEADAVIEAGKDQNHRVRQQMDCYRADGYPARNGLIESSILIVNLKHPASRKIMSDWWAQIERFSFRDQLSLNYVLWKNRATWKPLMEERLSMRDHFDFACLGHGANRAYVPSRSPALSQVVDPYAKRRPAGKVDTGQIAVDIVMCVHNALDEVKRSTEALLQAMRPIDRCIIVDDASDPATATFLDALVDANRETMQLVRHAPPARGYSAAANAGMQQGRSAFVLLLNSDAYISRHALEKMLSVAVATPSVGIVGPMSNAASFQSIPDTKATHDQTAVNALPPGYSAVDLDRLCEEWTDTNPFPSVPLVHGFCQLIRRELLEQIGTFDQASFPKGYGEENDLCFRATDAGYDLKVATHAFVYHAKSASYRDPIVRAQLMRDGAEALKRKHSPERVARAVATMQSHRLLVRMRERARRLTDASAP